VVWYAVIVGVNRATSASGFNRIRNTITIRIDVLIVRNSIAVRINRTFS